MTRFNSDRRLYEELVRSHGRDVYRFAYRLCGNSDMADDLVQETFYEAWRSIGTLRERRRAKSWLFQIVRYRNAHAIRDRSRRVQAKTGNDQLNQLSDKAGPDVLAKLSDQEVLQRALGALDERYKEPFLLVFLEDFTCREAAELLNIPLGTVLSRIHRGRQFLRRFIRQLDPTVEQEGFDSKHTVTHDRQ